MLIAFNPHREVQRLSAMCCAKMAEPIKLQLGMLSWVGPGNMYYTRCGCSYEKRHFLVVSGLLTSIVKHRILEAG